MTNPNPSPIGLGFGFVLFGADVHKGFNKNSSTDGNRIQNPHIRNMILFFV